MKGLTLIAVILTLTGCGIVHTRDNIDFTTLRPIQQDAVCSEMYRERAKQFKDEGYDYHAHDFYNLSAEIEEELEDKMFVRIPKKNVAIEHNVFNECYGYIY